MAYTDIDDPSAYFQTTLYTGNGASSHAITHGGNSDLNADWVWIKSRSIVKDHNINDSVRGVLKALHTNDSDSESTGTDYLSAFNSNGFTVGSQSPINTNGATYASWNWKAGTSFTNDASGTGIGTIDSAGSVNQDAGFSIVSWTGTGSAGTIKHGLSTTPSMIIIKNRSSAYDWTVGHNSLGWTNVVFLNLTTASQGDTQFNNTAPTSSVFSIGTPLMANKSGDSIIAYCFADVKGYSKFGNYTGNGSTDGTFVYTGFKPGFVMIRNVNASGKWLMMDSKRPTAAPGNPNNARLFADQSTAESTASNMINLLSNGFKLTTSDSDHNASGDKNLYMAFAENPFVTSTAIPACAR
jgi:hypothetical protein